MNIGSTLRWGPFRAQLPAGWVTTPIPFGIMITPLALKDRAVAGWPADSILVQQVGEGQLEHVVPNLMLRRVRQGAPTISGSANFRGLSPCYAWSDGVSQMRSWFLVHHGTVFEVQRAEPLVRVGAADDYSMDARRVMESIHLE